MAIDHAADLSVGPVPVHWHEGLHLLPHHLQKLQKFAGDAVASQRLFYTRFTSGLLDLSVKTFKSTVTLDRLKAIMPSGAYLDLGQNTVVNTLDIKGSWDDHGSPLLLHLALPMYSEAEGNVVMRGETARATRRFQAQEYAMHDETVGASVDARAVQVLKYNARLVTAAEAANLSHYESIPLIRLRPEKGGEAILDEEYSPPLLRISAWAPFQNIIKDLLRELELARQSVAGRLRDGGLDLADLHGAQLAQLLKLRTANACVARLRVLADLDHTAPWEIFSELQAAHGELLALEGAADFDPAPFHHHAPFPQLKTLAENVVRLLEPAPTTQYVRLPFEAEGDYMRARAGAGGIVPRAQALLCLLAQEPQERVNDFVINPDRFRLTSRKEIGLFERGLRLARTAAPQGLRGNAQYHYFRIDPDSGASIWNQIVDSGEFMLDISTAQFPVSEYSVYLRQQ